MSITVTTLASGEFKTAKLNGSVLEHLQRQMANSFLLYANYKHYHWQAYGPLFGELHAMFNEFAQAVLPLADEFAQRLRYRGEVPMFDFREMLEVSKVHPSIRGATMRDMVDEAHKNVQQVAQEMRDGVRVARRENDAGSADLFARVLQIHEKHEWFLRELLRHNDRLTR